LEIQRVLFNGSRVLVLRDSKDEPLNSNPLNPSTQLRINGVRGLREL